MHMFKEFAEPGPDFKSGCIVPIGTKVEEGEAAQHLLWLQNYIYYYCQTTIANNKIILLTM